MSATTALRLAAGVSREPASDLARPKISSRSRPSNKIGRGAGPVARPTRVVPAPQLRSAPTLPVRGCSAPLRPRIDEAVAPLPARVRAGVRLTERGIAVVLVTGLMIVLAAVTVVGLTAVRVTGERAQPLPAPYAAQP